MNTMETAKIIVLCVIAACVYGIVHDQVTAHVCVEYFTIGHPPVLGGTDSPVLLGLIWGVIATWWVGLPLGVMAALAVRIGRWPKQTARQLVRPIGILLLVMGALALVAGVIGFVLGEQNTVWLLEPLASKVPPDRHALYLADLWAHLASYASGVLGGIVLCIVLVVRRAQHARANEDSATERGA